MTYKKEWITRRSTSTRLAASDRRVRPTQPHTLADKELRLAIINDYVRRVDDKLELEAYPRLSG
jgi:hypothetical protein